MNSQSGKSMVKIIKCFYNHGGQLLREQVDLAAELIELGGVIAVPTDTIYGLAVKASNTSAIDRIYSIKTRDKDRPLAVCVSSIEEIDQIADTSILKPNLIRCLLPGPLTLLLHRLPSLNPNLNRGLQTVGVRVPDHNFIRALASMCGPLALTSANQSGATSPIEVKDFEDIHPQLDCIFDCDLLQTRIAEDPNNHKLGSTVVDLTKKNLYTIVREGCALNRTIMTLNRFGYKDTKSPAAKGLLETAGAGN